MIEKIIFHAMSCDNCKCMFADYDTNEFFIFEDELDLIEIAIDNEWRKINDKWYCPDCDLAENIEEREIQENYTK